ncbi:MAG: 3-oxoacyl-ACP reductase family protein [Chloroflexota bacterium]
MTHIALVTGGSRGIGRATCLALAANGAAVAVHYHARAEAAAEVVAAITQAGGCAVAVQADVRDSAAISSMIEQVSAELGAVDILVNNAGEMTDSSVEAMSDDQWDDALALNLSSAFRCARSSLPAMRAQGWGRIVNVASQVIFTGSVNHAHYAAAKSGLLGLTFSLAKEVSASGVTVNLVSPGRIVTDMIIDKIAQREQEWLAQTPMRRLGQPEEVASVIAFLASDAASYVTGANLNVNGGLVMG